MRSSVAHCEFGPASPCSASRLPTSQTHPASNDHTKLKPTSLPQFQTNSTHSFSFNSSNQHQTGFAPQNPYQHHPLIQLQTIHRPKKCLKFISEKDTISIGQPRLCLTKLFDIAVAKFVDIQNASSMKTSERAFS